MAPSSLIQSLSRSFDIIERLCRAPEGMGVTQLAAEVGLAKTTVHRILRALVERGYVYQDPSSGVYGPGTKILELAAVLRGSMVPQHKIGPLVRDLERQTGENAFFATASPDRRSLVICNEELSTRRDVLVGSARGRGFPLDGDRAALAYVAQMSDYQRDVVMRRLAERLTPADLERVRREIQSPLLDFYVSRDAMGEGITSVACIVRDHTGYAVGLLGVLVPAYRVDPASTERLAAAVRSVAARAALALGYGGRAEREESEAGPR
jgi:DNA-binding IclR family transcriptional regulator